MAPVFQRRRAVVDTPAGVEASLHPTVRQRDPTARRPAFRWALLEWVDDVLGCRSVRGVQAVRLGGKPVHHRVPLLRAQTAPARAQAAAHAGHARLTAARQAMGEKGTLAREPAE